MNIIWYLGLFWVIVGSSFVTLLALYSMIQLICNLTEDRNPRAIWRRRVFTSLN